MAEKFPLLLFPEHAVAERSKLHGGGGNVRCPSHGRQIERIGPRFPVLEEELRKRKVQLTDNPESLDPEEVLVLDIAGDVAGFVKAVNSVEGLEWLGEMDTEITSDGDFFDEKNPKGNFGGKIYLTASNSTAISQIVSLWHIYEKSNIAKFPHGQASIKHVFEQLRTIRFWGPEDRLYPDDVEFWLECIEQYPDDFVKIEIELWFRGTPQKRKQAEESVSSLISNSGGRIISRSEIIEIRYHSLLAEIPGGMLRDILNNIGSNELVQNNNIMLFRPSGQQITVGGEAEAAGNNEYVAIRLRDMNPRVAVFDGLPLENHEALRGNIIIDDPDDFTSSYRVTDRSHGTQMCSLVIRGDLMSASVPIDTPVYVRPIMKPNAKGDELIPDDVLIVDLIHRAVKRMKEGEGGNPPIAPAVKVINFSIGDPRRIFYNSMSPMARLMDWLAYKYNVLFVISSGNACVPFITTSAGAFNKAGRSEQSRQVFSHLLSQRSELRLIAPAESINNITVGAVHADSSKINPYDKRLNPYDYIMPSIYTRIGSGFRKSIKPDLVYAGGRQLYNEVIVSNSDVLPSTSSREPGINVAVPDDTRRKSTFNSGTSHATALISHNAAYCIDVLESIGVPEDYQAIMVKAMLIHGCSWDIIEQNIRQYLCNFQANDQKKIITQWIGYGIPEIALALECNPKRATAIAFDDISIGAGHIYRFPLPPSLASKTYNRRLSVTLAWFTPINPASHKYRQVKLWFETPSMMSDNRYGPDWQKVRNGTLQHEVFDGDTAQAFVDGDNIVIKISCAEDASVVETQVKYALIVSLDVKDDIDLPIYQEVAERIASKVPVTQQ